ncbi:GAF and ANTAR domain-containing protein [Kribbella sp. NPDC048915]|uniref:GAF and ANTAR domain-containing protein n=1 Tax=Kribbella sp. NPDC048915 TaxID=3155148 RepID=UPI0033E54396
MNAADASQAFVNAAAAMVGPSDVVGTLTGLLDDCGSLTGASALGVLVRDPNGGLELLAATSHATAELELYQIQRDSGPCIETVDTGHPIHVTGRAEIEERWGDVGRAITAAGYVQVNTRPLHWHSEVIGAMNAFHRADEPLDADALRLSQAFADMATTAIVQAGDLAPADVAARIAKALQSRIVIEQAKGALAEEYGIDMAEAYQRLVRVSRDHTDETLTETAARILREAQVSS